MVIADVDHKRFLEDGLGWVWQARFAGDLVGRYYLPDGSSIIASSAPTGSDTGAEAIWLGYINLFGLVLLHQVEGVKWQAAIHSPASLPTFTGGGFSIGAALYDLAYQMFLAQL